MVDLEAVIALAGLLLGSVLRPTVWRAWRRDGQAHEAEPIPWIDRWFSAWGAACLLGGMACHLWPAPPGTAWLSSLPDLVLQGSRILGWIALGTGVLLIHWADHHLARRFTLGSRALAGSGPVTSGPYHRCRHPAYLGFLLLGLGCCLLTGNAWLALLWFGGAGLVMPARIRAEEASLAGRFGQAWEDYRQRSAALFPGRPG